MESLLHGFLGATVVRSKFPKLRIFLLAFLIGMLPDLLGSGPWMYYRRVLLTFVYDIPQWTLVIYNSTHNLFAALLVFLIIYFVNKKYLILGLPYLLHILTDIPFHCEPIGTKLFYPLSNWSFCGPFFSKARLTTLQAFLTTPGNLAIQSSVFIALIVANFLISRKLKSVKTRQGRNFMAIILKRITKLFQTKKFKKIVLILGALFYIAVIFIAFKPEPFLRFGYLGVFVFNLFGPGTILIPSLSRHMDVFLLSIVGSAGMVLNDSVGWLVGRSGDVILPRSNFLIKNLSCQFLLPELSDFSY